MSKREKKPGIKLLIDFYMGEIKDPNSSKSVKRQAARQLDKLYERLDKLSEAARRDRDRKEIALAQAKAAAETGVTAEAAPEEPSEEDKINRAFTEVLGGPK